MTVAFILAMLLALVGWRLSYLWWRECQRLKRELKDTLTEQVQHTTQDANTLALARNIVLMHSLSGKIEKTPHA